MRTFQVRNKRTKIILGEVVVDDPEKVIDALKEATGCSIEEIALSLGSTLDEAKEALDIVELPSSEAVAKKKRAAVATLQPRRLFA